MNKTIEKLLEVLEQEAQLYGELAGLLGKEREAMRRLDMARLEEHLGTKAVILGRIVQLEKERAGLASTLAAEQGWAGEKAPSLLDLLRRIPAPWAGRLMEVRLRLRQFVERVGEGTDSNRRFVEGILAVMEGAMENLRSAVAGPSLYGRKGKLGARGLGGGDFLRQAI